MSNRLRKNQVKDAILEGRKVKANNWEISINERDEVVIFPPSGDGFSTTLANLDQAVDDYCKKANTKKPGSPSRHNPKRSETKVGPDSETQNLLKAPSIKKRDVPSGGVKPDMAPGSESDQPYTPKPRDKSPDVYPAPGGGGMPSTELGSDSEGDIKWDRGARIRDTFTDDPGPVEFYRDLRAKKPSAELLKDITNERKWVANNRGASVPDKWEKTVKDLKDEPDVDNPYALTNWMDNQGYTPGGKDKKKSNKRRKAWGWADEEELENFQANYENLTLEDLKELDAEGKLVDILASIGDSSWYDEFQGSHEYGPYGGWYYELYLDKAKGFYAILGTTEMGSHLFDMYNSEAEAREVWDDVANDALDTAYGNDDLEYFDMTEEEYLEEKAERKKSNKRRKAGPKLREKWDDKGSYHRDIEAESPEELHALTRAFGGEEVDWSPFNKDPVVEAEEGMDEVVAKKSCSDGKESELDVEAVDEKAKDYYDKYFEEADSDYGKQLTKGDITDRRKRDRMKKNPKHAQNYDWVTDEMFNKKLKEVLEEDYPSLYFGDLYPIVSEALNKEAKKAQAAPTPRQPAAPQAAPQAAPAAPAAPTPGAPAPAPGGAPPAPKPGAPGEVMKPGTGDAGLQALGWTPDDIQLLDEEDKQKILQIQLNRPGTKQPKPAPTAPPKGTAPPAPGSVPGAPAPVAPTVPAQPQKQVPAPVAKKLAMEILEKLKFKKARMLLTGQEIVPTEPAAPAAPAAPVAPAAPAGERALPEFQPSKGEEAAEGATVEQRAFQILSEVQQMPVSATTPESVPPMKAQELSKRLLTELGMPIEEAKNLFGVSKSGQGLITLFK